MLSFFLIG